MSNKNTNKVDKIRDLIFGHQIKDFEKQFDKVNDSLIALEDKMTKIMHESHLNLQQETERSLDALDKKIDKLSHSTQKDKTKLKEQLDLTDKNLQVALNSYSDKFVSKFKIMKENIAYDNKIMSENMAVMQHEIEATLKKKLSSLSDEKLSRDSMAQMLLDVAMKIQDKDVAGSTALTKGKKSGK